MFDKNIQLDPKKFGLKQSVTNQKINQIVDAHLLKSINKKSWLKTDNVHGWFRYRQLFQILNEVTILQWLYLNDLKEPKIFIQICEVGFPRLKVLQASIIIHTLCREQFFKFYLNFAAYTHAKFMQTIIRFINLLFADNNHIVQLRSLRKMYIPELKVLNLSDNNIKSCQILNKMGMNKLNSLILQNNIWPKLYLTYKNDRLISLPSQSGVMGQSISWLSKLNCNMLQIIKITSQKRMLTKRIDQMLNEKFNQNILQRKSSL